MAEADTTKSASDGTGAGAGGDGGGDGAGGAGQSGGDGAGRRAEGGGEAKSWLDTLPEDIRENPTLKRYPSLEEGARALISATGRLGVPAEELVRLPKPDDADGQAALWNKVGRPEKVDGYGEIKLPEGSPIDKDALQGFLATMHASGPFLPGQAQKAAEWYVDFAKSQQAAIEADFAKAQAEARQTLKGEWGAATDQNIAAAGAAALKFGGKDFLAYLEDSKLGDDPRALKAWKAVADAMGEAGAAPAERGRDTGGGKVLSPSEARAELTKMEGDKEVSKALLDGSHPHHDHHQARRLELIRLANANTEEKTRG